MEEKWDRLATKTSTAFQKTRNTLATAVKTFGTHLGTRVSAPQSSRKPTKLRALALPYPNSSPKLVYVMTYWMGVATRPVEREEV